MNKISFIKLYESTFLIDLISADTITVNNSLQFYLVSANNQNLHESDMSRHKITCLHVHMKLCSLDDNAC